MITAKAPGKLYIAGEYAVVETGHPAIIVAIDQYVTVSIKPADTVGTIVSKQYNNNTVMWQRQGNEMVIDNRDNPFHYILSAIKYTEKYACLKQKDLQVYHLQVNSQLDAKDGKKYGLGSSAAVTVATVKALNRLYDLQLNQLELYKLAALAHLEVQGNGSLGDIAASVFGGFIAYASFDKQWLNANWHQTDLDTLVHMTWPGLKIQPLEIPNNLQLLIGWSGSPASTSRLVDQITLTKTKQKQAYQAFLQNSNTCVNQIIQAFKQHDLLGIQNGIRQNRQILKDLAKISHTSIETTKLAQLCEIAESHLGAAKTSGAGGGDCGIVIIDATKTTQIEQLLTQWQQNEIVPLTLAIHYD